MALDKATIRRVHAAIEVAVRKVAEAEGFTVLRSRMSYDDAGFKVNIGAAWKAGTVSNVDGEQVEWQRYAPIYGLPSDALGKSFKVGARVYKIVGIRPTAHKRPIIAECNGKRFVFAPEDVRIFLGRAA